MTRKKKWLTAIGGLFVVLVAAIVLVVIFFQWDWLKGPLEVKLDSLTGKKVTIGHLQGSPFSWTPHLDLTGVEIEDPNWKPNPRVAQLERIGITIDLHRLLHGTLDFPLLEFDKPVLALERRADGKANWDIASEASGPSKRSNVPIIELLKINDGKLAYRDEGERMSINGTIATAIAKSAGGQEHVELSGKGTYQNAPMELRISGDPLTFLRDTKKPYGVEASVVMGRTRAHVKGTMTDPVHMVGLDLNLEVQGENAHDLYDYLHIPAPATPPYRLNGRLDHQGDIWEFNSFKGAVGHSDLEGSLKFDTGKPRLFVSGNLVSRNLNFQDTGILVGAPASSDATTKAPDHKTVSEDQVQVRRQFEQSDRLLPDAPLDIDEVRSVDADVTFRGVKVQAQDLPLNDVSLHVRMNNGVLTLDPLNIGVAGGRMAGAIVIDLRDPNVKTQYDLKFMDFRLQDFFDKSGKPGAASGVINARIRLDGIGNSVRRSLGTANGTASMIVNRGTVSKLASDLLGLDVVRSLGLLVTGDRQTQLRCMVLDFDVRNGLMNPRTFALDTPDTLATATGTISLTDERLNLEVKGTPKNPSVTLGGPIEVRGTFRKPSVGLGTETVARGAVAAALGAVLSPLASIIGFIHPGGADDLNCPAIEQQIEQKAAQQPPVKVPHPQSPPPPARAREAQRATSGKATR